MSSSEASSRCTIHFPPERPKVTQPSVIAYGTIEPSSTDNWTTRLSASLSDLPVTILNPRCNAWDSTWNEDINFPPFKEQVDWEMDYADVADVIVFYFKPGTPCPVSLLELGMYVGIFKGKVVVCCPQGFNKKGNVDIVCTRFGVTMAEDLEKLNTVVRGRLEKLLGNT
ncbi:hypothetical protein P280DRAFT_499484 [Massarina eburnea CBS 473.64]|uniref:Nucleoside 2-deoxyribosyltransferase domain-containing protein n=1 Tax=Massarina eburnea CBS 473.64 TaxID=1395130 RepID=A0A6A6RUG1_9PLEO|nr:hypothetical protein P280DRAFT_499484 [Massarina eburnea CBS 473.64]